MSGYRKPEQRTCETSNSLVKMCHPKILPAKRFFLAYSSTYPFSNLVASACYTFLVSFLFNVTVEEDTADHQLLPCNVGSHHPSAESTLHSYRSFPLLNEDTSQDTRYLSRHTTPEDIESTLLKESLEVLSIDHIPARR